MKYTLVADGRTASSGAPLVMHNERLADPLDPFTQAISEISHKRGKTTADHEEIGYLEFMGGLYTTEPLTWPLNGHDKAAPCIPAWNLLRCLQDGGKRHKRGADVLRGVYPIDQHSEVQFDGPADPVALWQAGGFSLRKSVGVQRSRTMRTRPIFVDWQLKLPVEVDATVFDVADLRKIWKDAGVYYGLGDMRPVYGRFTGTVEDG